MYLPADVDPAVEAAVQTAMRGLEEGRPPAHIAADLASNFTLAIRFGIATEQEVANVAVELFTETAVLLAQCYMPREETPHD